MWREKQGIVSRCAKAIGITFLGLCAIGFWQPAHAQTKKPVSIYHLKMLDQRIDVLVTHNKSETVKVDYPFTEALVGNPEIADVVPLTNQSVYILGKKIGVTRLSLLDAKKQVLGVVDIEVSYDMDILRKNFHHQPEFSRIKVSSVAGKLLLSGVAPDAVTMQRALTLAQQVAPNDVTNGMSVAAPQQVMLEVRFIEASRNAERGLGVSWGTGSGKLAGGTGGAVGGAGESLVNLAAGLASNSTPFGSFAGRILGGGVKADVFVNALESKGLARKLAEPNLVALSGDTASFLAGGEFPFPVSVDNSNQVSVEFKKFGVGLSFTPTVLANGQINLKIDPEVSELDTVHTVSIGNYKIPSISVRRASTTIEMRDGQSFAIAGLLQGSHVANTQQLPWIGDVPVLGALFRSADFQKNETDLVIIVTPRLIRPAVPGEKLATPLDNSKPANDTEFFVEGKQEVRSKRVLAPPASGGHMLDYNAQSSDAPVSLTK